MPTAAGMESNLRVVGCRAFQGVPLLPHAHALPHVDALIGDTMMMVLTGMVPVAIATLTTMASDEVALGLGVALGAASMIHGAVLNTPEGCPALQALPSCPPGLAPLLPGLNGIVMGTAMLLLVARGGAFSWPDQHALVACAWIAILLNISAVVWAAVKPRPPH